ncbi:MAG: hypothetical protein HZB23_07205 [Deltaproteobacteria bacterium]|nr:hypothetical protein [Deltaproteobacteria bacterium]
MTGLFDEYGRFDRNTPQGRAAISAALRWMLIRDRLSWIDVSYRMRIRPRIPALFLRVSDKAKRTATGLLNRKNS